MQTKLSREENSPEKAKKPYQAPQLKREGKVKELTLDTGSGGADNGTQLVGP